METKEHAHMKKLVALEERIELYYICNSEKDEEGNQEFITDLRRKCMKDSTHRIGKGYMQTMNHLWHQYRVTGNMNDIYHVKEQ